NEELERSYKAHTNLYDGFLLGCLLYGVLTTAFKALTSEACINDGIIFFKTIWGLLVRSAGFFHDGRAVMVEWIPIPPIITHILYTLLMILLVVEAVFFGHLGIKKWFEWFTKEQADGLSLIILLVSLAVLVYFADPIRAILPINLLLFFLIVQILAMVIRAIVDHNQRRY
ncbi:MAG: hypothetical protein IJL07_01930, partial [Lachnospiraceae bacterium]|nr:hypothetical protein [Lachnospiraceae bacterium]